MLKLSSPAAVKGSNSPPVTPGVGGLRAFRQRRLNGKNHARYELHFIIIAKMLDKRKGVEILAYSVTAVPAREG